MINTRLEINGTSQAIVTDIPVSINFVLADIREPDKRNASFSKTISLYATNEINKLFENIFEVNVVTQYFNKNKKTPCKYYVNDLLNFKGDLQLLKITIKPDGLLVYDCVIIGEGGSLFLDIGEKFITGNTDPLHDLDFSAYDHTYDRATQIALNTANVNTGMGVLYPFVDRGTNGGLDYKFDVEDFLPCLSFWEYFNKILTMAGYTYTSSIIDSQEFKNYILFPNIINVPVNSSQLNNAQFYLGDDSGGGNISYPINIVSNYLNNIKYIFPLNGGIGTSPFFDLGNQYNNSNYEVTLNNNGKYNIVCVHDLVISWTHTNPLVDEARFFGLKLNSTIEYSNDGGSTWYDLASNIYEWKNQAINSTNFDSYFIANCTTGSIPLFAGTKLRHSIRLHSITAVGWYYGGSQITTGTGSWDINWNNIQYGLPDILGTQFYGLNTSKNITTGQTMIMNNALPTKIKQKDFVKSVIQALNLQIEPDKLNPKHLYIESYSDFYNGEVIDFENRTDLDKEQIINTNILKEKSYILKYKSDTDYYNNLYQNTYRENFGTEQINVENDFNKSDNVTEIIFSATPNVGNNWLGVAHPRIYSYENNTYKPIAQNIRWLYCGGYKQCGGFTYTDVFQNDLFTTDYLYAGHTDDPFYPTIDLNFGTPKEVYYNYPNAYFTNNNLYNRFHKAYIDNAVNQDSKFVIKYLWVTPNDINKFSFRQRFFIDGSYYIVNKIIDYNPLKQDSIQFELIKLLETELFVPQLKLLVNEPNINTGNDIKRQINNNAINLGSNNQINGINNLIIGNNNYTSVNSNNLLIVGNNITVADNLSDFTYINGLTSSSIINNRGSVIFKTNTNYNIKAPDDLVLMTTGAVNRTVYLNYGTIDYIYDNVAYTINGVDVSYDLGKIVTIKKIDAGAGNVIIDGSGALIDGAATQTLVNQYDSLTLQFDGTNWNIK